MRRHWDTVTFLEAPLQIVDGDRGRNYPKQTDFSEEGHCVFLNTGNVTESGFNLGSLQFIEESKDDALGKGKLTRDDVVMTTRGTIGNVAHYNENISFDHMRINSGMVIFRCDQRRLSPLFLYHVLRSPNFEGQMNSLRSGAAQPQLPIRDIKQIKLPLPPLVEQLRVANVVAAYDDLIENNRRRMALMEEAARQLYCEWFVRFHFPGYEHTRVSNGVPEGWEQKRLGDLCEEVRESVLPDTLEPDTPYIGLEHIPRRSISLGDWGRAEQVTSSKHRFCEGEILFGKIRPYFHKVGVAFVDGVASSDAIVIRPLGTKLRGLVLMIVSSDQFIAVTSQTMKEGSKMPRADWKQMQQFAVCLPPDSILTNFDSVIQRVVEQLKTLSFVNQKLRAARDLLLPRLMSGEITL